MSETVNTNEQSITPEKLAEYANERMRAKNKVDTLKSKFEVHYQEEPLDISEEEAEVLVQWLNASHNDHSNIVTSAVGIPEDHIILDRLRDSNFMLSSFAFYEQGEFGYALTDLIPDDGELVKPEGDKHLPFKEGDTLHLTMRLWPRSESVRHEALKPFNEVLQSAKEKDQYIMRKDDPLRLRIGFLLFTGHGIIWHTLPLRIVKSIWSPPALDSKAYTQKLQDIVSETMNEEDKWKAFECRLAQMGDRS